MKKLSSSFKNMLISLTLISVVAGFSLAYMNEVTMGPINESRKAKKINAIKAVLPKVTNDPYSEKMAVALTGLTDSFDIFPGKSDNKINSIAISTFTDQGYNGLIKLMVGLDTLGIIKNIAVLEQKETPGLGTKINTEKFLEQYRGKDPGKWKLKVKKDGGETDAITGATISSRAFNDAVQKAYDVYKKEKGNLIK
ncbi:MAG: RnfABCDGE type electron transport complex subunit G [Saprospiraceae bacterium]|nr:RnfABCDGE type electron transport complex subunit G [Saprospiraceae bacterium]